MSFLSLEMSMTLRIKPAAMLWCHVLHIVSTEPPEGIYTGSVMRKWIVIEK